MSVSKFAACAHAEQLTTATKILDKFIGGDRQVLLAAQMQSGKTGIFLTLALMMLDCEMVGRVVVICGSNETELHRQLMESCDAAVGAFAAANGLDAAATAALRARIVALKSTGKADGFEGAERIDRDTLVVWDESHFAQSTANLPFKYLTKSGLCVSGTAASDAKWSAKNCYFLSVSATPFAEYSDVHSAMYVARITRSVVWHTPSPLYRGVAYYAAAGVIRESYSLKEGAADFTTLLASYAHHKQYALVRSRNLATVKACCRVAGVRYLEYTSAVRDLTGGMDALSAAPSAFTVIGMKGMCRMGKVVPKRHIAFAFEEAKTSKTDCILQSFLGRMCGHDSAADPFPETPAVIYVPAVFKKVDARTGYSELERYLRFTAGEIITPTSASCLAAPPKVSGKYTLLARFVPFAYDAVIGGAGARRAARPADGAFAGADAGDEAGDEDYVPDETDPTEDEGGVDHAWHPTAVERARVCDVARAYIAAHPYADAIQQTDALAAMAPAACEFHHMMARTYAYVRDRKPNIVACATDEKRWDDRWNAQQFKFYKTEGGFYMVGWTTTACEATMRECRVAVVPTTGKEVWNPATEKIVAATDPSVVRNQDELLKFVAAPSDVQRVVYIDDEFSRATGVKRVLENVAAAGKGGKVLTEKTAKSLGVDKSKLKRFVIPAGVTITISISVDVRGNRLFDAKHVIRVP
jgi:hypothetical protein